GALSELDEVATPPMLKRSQVAAPPGISCEDVWFTGVGGAQVHAQLLRPLELSSPGPALVMFHGYAGAAGDWDAKFGWTLAGFTVLAMDVRGQSGTSTDVGGTTGRTFAGHFIRGVMTDTPQQWLFRNVFLDVAQVTRYARQLDGVDPTRVATLGGSQGGALAVVAAALVPEVARCMTRYPFLSDYQRVWELALATDAYAELRDHFRSFDPRHAQADELWQKLGYLDIQHLASRIRAEVLMQTCLDDTVCPPSTQFAMYNKVTAAKSLEIYPDFGHEKAPGMEDSVWAFLLPLLHGS
ncbi:MAG: alpha/beta fold hydrolase, partial [Nocardioidaceae bacterium]|nr:alpha/beta fold hydrolase [Nocardioidaceae bacterium]